MYVQYISVERAAEDRNVRGNVNRRRAAPRRAESVEIALARASFLVRCGRPHSPP